MRLSSHKFDSEAELAAAVVKWLGENGWDVYQEVQVGQGMPVCDIVAVKMTDVWSISCKNSLSLKVLLQADYWRGRKFSHFSSIAVPAPMRPKRYYSNPMRSHYDSASLLEKLGIGMLVVSKSNEYSGLRNRDPGAAEFDFHVEKLQESMHQDTKKRGLLAYLRDEHKTYAKAGAAGGGHWTPFRGTVDRLVAFVEKNPGTTMKKAIGSIQHHYKSEKSAQQSLLSYIQNGVIAKIQLVKSGNAYNLYTHEQWAEKIGR